MTDKKVNGRDVPIPLSKKKRAWKDVYLKCKAEGAREIEAAMTADKTVKV